MGDVIPFAAHGRIWLFYLLDDRANDDRTGGSAHGGAPGTTGMPWALVSTRDFVRYEEHGVVLPSGGADAADYDCYTGSVVDDGERLHLYYTGHHPGVRTPDGDLQVVCHATSEGDPTAWVKHPEWRFGAPPGFAPEDWRDPFVFRLDDGSWRMVLAARRADGPERRRGTVATLASNDLVHWEPVAPLWDPRRYITQECPDVFRWGEWWYLVYSEFSDAFQTRYRIARSPDGPWLAPEFDSIDGRAFYAAKSVAHGGRRVFAGWIATKEDDCDDGAWQWAGELSVLEAVQQPDGALAFCLPEELVRAHSVPLPVGPPVPVDGAAAEPGAGALDRFALWLAGETPRDCLITAVVDIERGTHACGLLLRASDDGDAAAVLRLEPLRARIVLDRWPRGRTGDAQWQVRGDVPHAIEVERPCPLAPGRHTIEVLLEGSALVAVVDGRVALSARCYDRTAGRIGLFACDGGFRLVSLGCAVRPDASPMA